VRQYLFSPLLARLLPRKQNAKQISYSAKFVPEISTIFFRRIERRRRRPWHFVANEDEWGCLLFLEDYW